VSEREREGGRGEEEAREREREFEIRIARRATFVADVVGGVLDEV